MKVKFVILTCLISLFGSIAYANAPVKLSLDEAILLAVRCHPNVQSSRLSYVEQKFALYVQKWEFQPHYALQASAIFNRGVVANQGITGSHQINVTPAASLLTPIGTQVVLTSTNPETSHYNPGLSLAIKQPLMRGFGMAVVEAALNNAKDSEVIARLNVEGTLRDTVTTIINAYLNVVQAEKTVKNDQGSLTRAQQSVTQTKLFIQAGHKAGNELVTVKANVATAEAQLENDKNSETEARYALLTAIGLDPDTNVIFTDLDLHYLESKYSLPTLDDAKHDVLMYDIQYQTDRITLYGPTQRSLLIAEDNTRWQLDFLAGATTGNGSGGGFNAGTTSLTNGENQAQSVGFTLNIPIDDQVAKEGVLNAKIALKQAQLALMQERWNKETSAINGWNLVLSAERSLRFANDAEELQDKTYQISYQKYLHGLIDSLELQTAQVQFIQAQQTALSAEINHIKSLVNLDLIIGRTLKTWHVGARV